MTDHPITPPPELVEEWMNLPLSVEESLEIAARWGANMELDACCKVILAILAHRGFEHPELFVELLLDKRRPKPPSMKELALDQLKALELHGALDCNTIHIRRALEALPND
jgi:hypothetical protein